MNSRIMADTDVAEQVVTARHLGAQLGDALSQLWILARRGEPSTEAERLIRRQVDDAMAEATEVFNELKETLVWIADHDRLAERKRAQRDEAFERFFLEFSSQGGLLAMLHSYPTVFAAFQGVQRWRARALDQELAQARQCGAVESEAAE